MASGLGGFGLYTKIKDPLLANYIKNVLYKNPKIFMNKIKY